MTNKIIAFITCTLLIVSEANANQFIYWGDDWNVMVWTYSPPDSDGDGLTDDIDTDDDNDGVLDVNDAFPLDPNETLDTDNDGIGNNADTDDDNDGVLDVNDAFPLDPNETLDTDSDGIGNNADTDDDNDGVLDINDAFPLDPNETLDTDNDGIGNNADTDDDNDGMPDAWEIQYGLNPLVADANLDADNDGISNIDEYNNNSNPIEYNYSGSVPGLTSGEFSVDASGSANYQIPIAVPPGTAGMQPSLTLSYNHRSSNGPLGVGWTLGGLSAITRCSATDVVDGFIDGVDFDSSDRFCIDGQRLIAISGAYGANGTEYRTEIDGFTKVISYGSFGSGPEKFKVWTKSGQILEYGYTDDSQFRNQSATEVLSWSVNKISDTVGNYLKVVYGVNLAEGYQIVDRILYTFNDAAGVSNIASVFFHHELRPDVAKFYIGGMSVKNKWRFTNIKTYVAGNLVRNYQFNYETSATTARSRLTSLTECSDDAATVCFEPITFQWKDELAGFNVNSGLELPGILIDYDLLDGGQQFGELVDVNGDGLQDYVMAFTHTTGTNYRTTYINTGSGWAVDTAYKLPTVIMNYDVLDSGQRQGEFVDVNGDGLPDFVQSFRHTTGQYYQKTYVNTGSGWDVDASYQLPSVIMDYDILDGGQRFGNFVDVNGDGLPDFVQAVTYSTGTNYQKTYINSGSSWVLDSGYKLPTVINNYSVIDNGQRQGEFVDVNGDGLPDFVQSFKHTTNVGYKKTYINTGSGWSVDAAYELPTYIMNYALPDITYQYGEFIDVNGDGFSDFVQSYERIGGEQYKNTYLNTGSGWVVDGGYQPPSIIMDYDLLDSGQRFGEFADVNGDGLPDFIQAFNHTTGNDYRNTYINTGVGWLVDSSYKLPTVIMNYDVLDRGQRQGQFSDINGDGVSDFIQSFEHTTGVPYKKTYTARSVQPDLLTTVSNSLGVDTSVIYKSITDDAVYTKGSNAVYPEVDIQGPVYVVSKVTVDDGIGGTRDTDYTYSEAKSSVNGRGFLGFKTMTAVDSSTGIKTKTTYSQTHPYFGLVKRTEQRLSNGDLLGEVNTTFDNKLTHTGIETDTSHPGVLFPYAATVTKKDYEID